MAGRHGQPSTGNGKSSGAKPQKSQMTVQTAGGTTLWKATAALFGIKKGGQKP